MIFFKVTSFFVVLVSVIAVSLADQITNFGNPLGEVLGSIINTANNVVQNNPNSPNTMPTTQIQPAPMHQVPIVPQAVPMHPAVAPSNTDHHPMHMLMNNLSVLAEQLHEQVQNAVASKNRSNVNQADETGKKVKPSPPKPVQKTIKSNTAVPRFTITHNGVALKHFY